ncbi:MAG: alpha/beta hydrolase [Pseudomonadota bacterium]|uniref:alpha/beta fold hydrolase n=1 Tax=Sphingomonas sp. ERG5 TaxID=1381597 RepID=UPI001F353007|nr:alpha/beta hydrolase [Sphingomonas sp. ERG5]
MHGSFASNSIQTGALASRIDTVETSDGARLAVRDWGSGEPMLFLSGWTLPSDFWGPQMVDFVARGHRCLSFDRRGHGRSSDPGCGYDHDTLADDIAAVIDTLGLRGLTVVAHSMATMEIARYFARHDGVGIERVVLVGATTPFLLRTEDNPEGIDGGVLAAGSDLLMTDFPAWIAANTDPFFVAETSDAMKAWGQRMMLGTSLLAAVQLAQANVSTDFRTDLTRIYVPTLVVHGDQDVSAPLAITGARTAALIPDARLLVYEGAPHGLPLTHAGRLARDITAFMAECG